MRVNWLDIEQIPFNFHVFRVDPAGVIPPDCLDFDILARFCPRDDLQVAAFVDSIFIEIWRARPIMANSLVNDHLPAQFGIGGNRCGGGGEGWDRRSGWG